MDYILALDAGTSSVRTVAFDSDGKQLFISQKEMNFFYDSHGTLCQDPQLLIKNLFDCIKDTLRHLKTLPLALAITNQRESFTLLDARGHAQVPLFSWQDRSTKDLCANLIAKGVEEISLHENGLPIDPYFSGPKVKKIMAYDRSTLSGTYFATVDTLICCALTDGRRIVTDPTNASRTLMFNTETLRFSPTLLGIFDADTIIMPEIVPSFPKDLFVDTSALPDLVGVPIAAVLGDQQASLIGQSGTGTGQGKITYGTGAFIVVNTGEKRITPKTRGLISTIAYSKDAKSATYALEGASFSAGSALIWLKDKVELIKSYEEIDLIARDIKRNTAPVFIAAFDGLGSPYLVSPTQAALFGLSRSTKKEEIVFSVVEGIANSVEDIIQAISPHLSKPIIALRVDGGVSQSSLLCQLQADTSRIEIQRSLLNESTAFGAFAAASYSLGLSPTLEEAAATNTVRETFSPSGSNAQNLQRHKLWDDRVKRTISFG